MGETAELLASLCFEVCPNRMPSWVHSVRRATQEEDHQGIDLVVVLDAGILKVQVKSSWKRAQEFKKKHPNIPVLVVHPEDSEEHVRRNLLSILGQERAKLVPGYTAKPPRGDRGKTTKAIPLTFSLGDRFRR